jgi:hypothetical protein
MLGRRPLAALLTIVGVLGFGLVAAPSAMAGWRLTPFGLGPLRVGMSPEEIEDKTGGTLGPAGLCSVLEPGPRGLALTFDEDDALQYIVLDRTRKLGTTRGLRVGDRTSRIFDLYGAEAKRMSSYDAAIGQGPDILYRPRSGRAKGYRIVFWTLRKRIVLMAAGRKGVERQDEFCA